MDEQPPIPPQPEINKVPPISLPLPQNSHAWIHRLMTVFLSLLGLFYIVIYGSGTWFGLVGGGGFGINMIRGLIIGLLMLWIAAKISQAIKDNLTDKSSTVLNAISWTLFLAAISFIPQIIAAFSPSSNSGKIWIEWTISAIVWLIMALSVRLRWRTVTVVGAFYFLFLFVGSLLATGNTAASIVWYLAVPLILFYSAIFWMRGLSVRYWVIIILLLPVGVLAWYATLPARTISKGGANSLSTGKLSPEITIKATVKNPYTPSPITVSPLKTAWRYIPQANLFLQVDKSKDNYYSSASVSALTDQLIIMSTFQQSGPTFFYLIKSVTDNSTDLYAVNLKDWFSNSLKPTHLITFDSIESVISMFTIEETFKGSTTNSTALILGVRDSNGVNYFEYIPEQAKLTQLRFVGDSTATSVDQPINHQVVSTYQMGFNVLSFTATQDKKYKDIVVDNYDPNGGFLGQTKVTTQSLTKEELDHLYFYGRAAIFWPTPSTVAANPSPSGGSNSPVNVYNIADNYSFKDQPICTAQSVFLKCLATNTSNQQTVLLDLANRTFSLPALKSDEKDPLYYPIDELTVWKKSNKGESVLVFSDLDPNTKPIENPVITVSK